MPKFFTDRHNITDKSLVIEGEEAAHIARVLRMTAGDELTVCDGCGTDYRAAISRVEKGRITADILTMQPCVSEPATRVVLYQALPKQGKMETIIQKNTELGIAKIVPVYTKRCVVKPSDKLERWRKVALSAAKQSGRGIIPEVAPTVSLGEAVCQAEAYNCKFMPYECEQTTRLKQVLSSQKADTIAFFVGPEGGFDPDEVQLAAEHGIQPVTLGPRILRTETAAAAVLAVILYEQGDI